MGFVAFEFSFCTAPLLLLIVIDVVVHIHLAVIHIAHISVHVMGLFGLIIYWAVRLAIRDSRKRGTSSDALEILKSRYARSEITADEFKRLKEEPSR
ncbi:SHOCT domain-containing protein [Desulforamulus ruminis]|uniref:SHOCT domain-containing protein n=1 Tax=Desulforamulus ruminis TaxID=1564 RepID=UPI002FDAD2EE